MDAQRDFLVNKLTGPGDSIGAVTFRNELQGQTEQRSIAHLMVEGDEILDVAATQQRVNEFDAARDIQYEYEQDPLGRAFAAFDVNKYTGQFLNPVTRSTDTGGITLVSIMAARRLGGSADQLLAARRFRSSAAWRLDGSVALQVSDSAARWLSGSAALRLGGSASRRLASPLCCGTLPYLCGTFFGGYVARRLGISSARRLCWSAARRHAQPFPFALKPPSLCGTRSRRLGE